MKWCQDARVERPRMPYITRGDSTCFIFPSKDGYSYYLPTMVKWVQKVLVWSWNQDSGGSENPPSRVARFSQTKPRFFWPCSYISPYFPYARPYVFPQLPPCFLGFCPCFPTWPRHQGHWHDLQGACPGPKSPRMDEFGAYPPVTRLWMKRWKLRNITMLWTGKMGK